MCPSVNFSPSFTMDKAHEIFTIYHSCQFIIDYVYFRDHLCPHIQGQILLIGTEMVSGTSINFNQLTWLKAKEELLILSGSYCYGLSIIALSMSPVFLPPRHKNRINGPCCSLTHSVNGAPCQMYDNIIISRKNFITSFSQIKILLI